MWLPLPHRPHLRKFPDISDSLPHLFIPLFQPARHASLRSRKTREVGREASGLHSSPHLLQIQLLTLIHSCSRLLTVNFPPSLPIPGGLADPGCTPCCFDRLKVPLPSQGTRKPFVYMTHKMQDPQLNRPRKLQCLVLTEIL